MIRKISFAIFLAVVLVFSAGAIQAGDADDINSSDADILLDDGSSLDGVNQSGNGSFEEKNQTQLSLQKASVYYGGSYRVTLTDSNTTAPLANRTVYFSIDDVAYSARTDSKGVASFKLKLNPGSYLSNAYFIGDDDYGPSNNLSGSVKVLTTIKAGDATKYYKGAKAYQATYLDSNGKPLKNKKVTIEVNGKKYTRKTNSKGTASLAMDFKPGTYKVSTSNPSTKEKSTVTFRILSTISASNLKKVKGDSRKFTAKFYKSSGKALSKKYVKVKIKGKAYWYKTNSKGQIKLAFNSFKKGTYKVVCYNNGLSKTNTVKVLGIASTKLTVGSYTYLSNDTKEVKIRFTTALDDSSKSAKTIKISVGGKTYSKKTDANGQISFVLPELGDGLYYLKCSYNGSKFFKSSSAGSYITVLSTSDAEFAVESGTSFGNFAGTPLVVSLTAGGVPLIKKAVRFSVDGKTYDVITDYYGTASITINLDVGNYTVEYESFGDDNVNGTSGACEIEVFERTATNISCKFASTYKDSSQTFKVRLTDSNGTPIAYEDVWLTIGGQTFSEMTGSDGYATFKLYCPVGKYKVSIAFKGNNDYKSSSISKSITIELSKFASGLNEKKGSASSAYLKATRYCQVGNSKIKALAKSLTKGLSSNLDKAKAIFNYVRDNIGYSYYYDSHKGATGTLTSKSANCVDQAHLLVALYRAAGLKARYVHGKCKFYDDGLYYGHVWTQVLVDNTWICGDPIGYDNELGQINNWNTNNFKVWGKYLALPF